MKSECELRDILDFIAEYASYLLGSGVHTSRVVRNSKRIGTSLDVNINITTFQKSAILTVTEPESRQTFTEVIEIPPLPISFEINSDLSALSWCAIDNRLTLDEIRAEFTKLISRPKINPLFVLLVVALANASFCKLFGGDLCAVCIVFSSTLVGFSLRQYLHHKGVNHYIIFILSAFIASLCASSTLIFEMTSEIALATSVLYLIPGVPLINGVIDIVEGHILTGFSRIINALLLVICIAIGLSATLLLVQNSLL
jgi:uncharacterized membrane protein YjjP (DUF1212 family)